MNKKKWDSQPLPHTPFSSFYTIFKNILIIKRCNHNKIKIFIYVLNLMLHHIITSLIRYIYIEIKCIFYERKRFNDNHVFF